jgi:hypothetical protein
MRYAENGQSEPKTLIMIIINLLQQFWAAFSEKMKGPFARPIKDWVRGSALRVHREPHITILTHHVIEKA